jgi:hypothetical protein
MDRALEQYVRPKSNLGPLLSPENSTGTQVESYSYAVHERQLGGGSPLHILMEEK